MTGAGAPGAGGRPSASPPLASRVAGNAVISGAQQLVSIAVGMLLLPYMLARMGDERYGVLLVVQLFSMSGLVAYADFGLAAAAMRYLAADYVQDRRDDFRELLATTIAAFAVIGAVSGVVVLAFAQWFFFRVFEVPPRYTREAHLALWLYAATLSVQFAMVGVRAFYAAVQDIATLKIWETIARVGYAVVIVALLLRVSDVFSIVVAEQVVSVTVFAVFAGVAGRRFKGFFTLRFWRATGRSLRRITGLGGHVFATHLSTVFVYQRVPEVFLAHYLGPTAVAHYAVISRIPRALKTLTAAASAAVAPAAAAIEGLARADTMRRLVLRGARYTYFLVTPLVTLLVVFAADLLRLWVGPEYAFLADALRVLLLWYFLAFIVLYTSATLTREEQYGELLRYHLAANAVFLGVTWAGVRPWGLWAVLWGLLLSLIISLVGCLRVQRGSRGVSVGEFFRSVVRAPILESAVATAAIAWLIGQAVRPAGLVGLLGAGAFAYFAVNVVQWRFGLTDTERGQMLAHVRRGGRRDSIGAAEG